MGFGDGLWPHVQITDLSFPSHVQVCQFRDWQLLRDSFQDVVVMLLHITWFTIALSRKGTHTSSVSLTFLNHQGVLALRLDVTMRISDEACLVDDEFPQETISF
jgi:hypothetical protein